ncbi:MAG: hypothetical protein KTR31_31910 [Myxococcales bacterium]|nr:hypothetical protein [Myxococcales bacterium]
MNFKEFQAAIVGEGARKVLFDEERPRFVLRADMFELPDLQRLFATARAIRRLDQSDDGIALLREVLHHRRVLHLFAQPSTRTCESFAAATHKLGGDARVVQDLEATSFVKGESVEDAVQVWAALFDLIVVRHADPSFLARCAYGLWRGPRTPSLVSGGSGSEEHPTQALLDVFTLADTWGGTAAEGLSGKRIAVVADLARNRAARSLLTLLTRFSGVEVHLVCPPAFHPSEVFLRPLLKRGLQLQLHEGLSDCVAAHGASLDALYITRMQQEWDVAGAPSSERGSSQDFVLHPGYRSQLSEQCRILHPLPRVNELPEAWDDHPGFLPWHQVRNGLWVRSALFAWMQGASDRLLAAAGEEVP